jgi:hypothetical protein
VVVMKTTSTVWWPLCNDVVVYYNKWSKWAFSSPRYVPSICLRSSTYCCCCSELWAVRHRVKCKQFVFTSFTRSSLKFTGPKQ